jgi:hypothetical protein
MEYDSRSLGSHHVRHSGFTSEWRQICLPRSPDECKHVGYGAKATTEEAVRADQRCEFLV